MSLKNFAYLTVSLFLIFYLLYIGKLFFIPFSISIVLWYIIVALSSAYKSLLRFGNFRLRSYSAHLLAIATIFLALFFFFHLIDANIFKLMRIVPDYQFKFKSLAYRTLDNVGVDTSQGLREVLESFDLMPLIFKATKLFTVAAGYLFMVFVFTFFLLLEYRKIGKKVKRIFNDDSSYGKFIQTIKNIDQDIKTYLKIKVLAGILIAFLSFLVFKFIDIELAVFCSFLIFILSFIPTVGAVVSISVPTAISLAQFDSVFPAIFIVTALALIHLSIGHILEPRFMGKSLNLSPLVIIIALTLWGSIWGVVGMFLCVPIMVITNIILAKFERTRPLAILLSARGKVD